MIKNAIFKRMVTKMKTIIAFIFLIIVFSGSPALADTHIVSSPYGATQVQAAINASVTDDIVSIPASTVTWSSGVDIPTGKKITLQGAGFTSTIVTREGEALNINESGSRVTGIQFVQNSTCADHLYVQGIGFRIDHNKFVNNYPDSCVSINVTGSNVTTLPTGLIDNNEFVQGRIVMNGMGTTAKQDVEWAKNPPIGASSTVFIEDNIFFKDVINHGNVVDANRGASYVARFNTIGGLAQMIAHGMQGEGSEYTRATKWWEVYKNTFTADSAIWSGFVGFRGGSGIVWGNTISGGYSYDTLDLIELDNDRSFYSIPVAGQCNGSSTFDGNTLSNGWPCRDQVGRDKDETLWGSPPYPTQLSKPVYFFTNYKGGSITDIAIRNGCEAWVVADRDYYLEKSNFNGTSGVGTGVLSARPATCTIGVGYWATDEGNWNQSGSGGQGVLYKCTAPNTWTSYYTPYTYPHPLRSESGDGTAPVITTKTIAANGTTLTLAFDETVSIGSGGNGGWTISPSGGAATLTYSSGSGSSSLVYTISRAIQYNETATVSYTQPTDGVEDTAGNDLVTFSGSSVTNSSTQGSDLTPPTVTLVSVNGATATITFDETVVTTGYDTGDFNLDCTSPTLTDVALSSPSGSGASRTFTIATPIVYGQVCNLNYVGSTNDIEDSEGNDMVAFSDMAVTNSTPQSGGTPEHSTSDVRGVVLRGVKK